MEMEQQQPRDSCSSASSSTTIDEGQQLQQSALNSRGDLTPADDVPILPNLPKYAICIRKGPSDFLGI